MNSVLVNKKNIKTFSEKLSKQLGGNVSPEKLKIILGKSLGMPVVKQRKIKNI